MYFKVRPTRCEKIIEHQWMRAICRSAVRSNVVKAVEERGALKYSGVRFVHRFFRYALRAVQTLEE